MTNELTQMRNERNSFAERLDRLSTHNAIVECQRSQLAIYIRETEAYQVWRRTNDCSDLANELECVWRFVREQE